MPTYEFECSACNKRVEHFLKMAERENPPPCVSCGATLKRIFTPPAVVLDGADPAFPGAAMKWEKDRARTMAREQKSLRESGEYYPNSRHW
jgi:putative FmdB family regulatory protein